MICHERKFIFVHVSKTGGTSIERTLDPDTPLTRSIRPSAKYGDTTFLGKHWTVEQFAEKHPYEFNTYYKFSFVRNPWDRLVSNWFWLKLASRCEPGTFDDWINNVVVNRARFKEEVSLLDESGQIGVNFIGRFENLQHDFDLVCEQLAIPKRTLRHDNKMPDRDHYSTFYTPELRDTVGEFFQWSINKFGYEF